MQYKDFLLVHLIGLESSEEPNKNLRLPALGCMSYKSENYVLDLSGDEMDRAPNNRVHLKMLAHIRTSYTSDKEAYILQNSYSESPRNSASGGSFCPCISFGNLNQVKLASPSMPPK